jgi:hypothetical protein
MSRSDTAVNADRRIRLWSLVVQHAGADPVALKHVCAAVISAANVDSAAITVAVSAAPSETVYVSNRFALVLEELALTMGEGPSVDALRGSMVLVADLAEAAWLSRWPMFTPAAALAGARAAFAFPLHVGGVRLGVLDLYRNAPGGLDGERLADVLVLADAACGMLLDSAAQTSGHPDAGGLAPVGGAHPVVHQATGMLIVQLGVNAATALTRLRAHAYAHDRRLRDVAADVVARRLRFEPDG